MADYIVTSGELTTVANAIRIKGGTNSQLVFPNGFVSAIGNISGGGGETWQTVFEGSVTTEPDDPAPIASIQNVPLTANTIKVTFNGTEYECGKNADDSYGAPFDGDTEQFDFSDYPFSIGVLQADIPIVNVFTETAGTYALKIEEPQSGGSSDFSTAEVTIANTTTRDIYIYMPVQVDDEEEDFSALICNAYVTEGGTQTVTTVLYKGIVVAYLNDSGEFNVSVSGSAEYDSPNFDITGDCTITIS